MQGQDPGSSEIVSVVRFDRLVDALRELRPAAEPRRHLLAEGHPVWRRPGLGMPQLGATEGLRAVEEATLDREPDRQQSGLAARTETSEDLLVRGQGRLALHA